MNGLLIFLAALLILFIGRSIFIPLLVAVFMWYLINAIATYYRKVLPFKAIVKQTRIINTESSAANKVFDWVAMLLSIASFGALIYAFATQIRPMFSQLAAKLPEIQEKLLMLGDYFANAFGLSFNSDMLPSLSGIASTLGQSAANMATSIGMILVYMLFLFIEQGTFGKKLNMLFMQKSKLKKTRFILQSIDENMKKYMFMKTAVSALTAVLSYFWLQYLGMEFVGVWAFIIFLLNYIPTFGSIIACTLPILYSLVSADSLHIPLLVAGGLIGIQVLLGNLIEPKLTGKTLNLSTLAILVNLVFWGMIWGPVGAFFSVPLLVATFIITAQFDKTRWVAVLLSADGNIPDKEDD